ncbi:hypothetical protein APS47_10180 [Leptospira kirschneri serovar Mozdok]|nr:Uncharacterized protein NV38_0000776 [Leptospira kirschneri serovar Mozdok]KPZ77550.1 hypothetical protein APS47_10180 [Leptospira kirschneri serovar Mozdok]NDK04571.1 hypothetical protein [Leptospira kirschneri serovar Mozdok]
MFKIYYLVSKNDPLKFWNLEIIGNSFTVIYCDMVDLHTETEETQVFETDEICFQKAEKLLCEKLNSEYQEANPKTLQRIDQLEDRLGSLAMKYRACDLESEEEKKIISVYHKVLNILFGRDLFIFGLRGRIMTVVFRMNLCPNSIAITEIDKLEGGTRIYKTNSITCVRTQCIT